MAGEKKEGGRGARALGWLITCRWECWAEDGRRRTCRCYPVRTPPRRAAARCTSRTPPPRRPPPTPAPAPSAPLALPPPPASVRRRIPSPSHPPSLDLPLASHTRHSPRSRGRGETLNSQWSCGLRRGGRCRLFCWRYGQGPRVSDRRCGYCGSVPRRTVGAGWNVSDLEITLLTIGRDGRKCSVWCVVLTFLLFFIFFASHPCFCYIHVCVSHTGF